MTKNEISVKDLVVIRGDYMETILCVLMGLKLVNGSKIQPLFYNHSLNNDVKNVNQLF